MMNNWIETTVRGIAAKQKNALVGGPFGSNLVRGDYRESGVPVIRGQNMSFGRWIGGEFAYVSKEKADALKANIARPGDLIFTQRGSLGQISIVPDKPFPYYIVSQSQMKLTVDDTIADTVFLYYLFNTHAQQEYVRLNAIQTGVPHTNLGILCNTPIQLPCLDEQKAIAHILGTLDDKIELNRRMNKALEEIARAIFKKTFIDFTKAGLPPEWKVGTLGEELNITMGQSPPGSTYNEIGNGLPFYQGRSDFGFRFPTRRMYCSEPTRFAETGDTLVSVRAPVGSLNMAEEKCCIGRGVAAIRHKSSSRSYTYYLMHSIAEKFERFEAEGTVFGSIGKSDFEQIECICPPKQVINDFEVLVFPIDQCIETNEKQSRTLAALRDTLLPKLLSGEIRIKDVEKFIGEPIQCPKN